jgi:hypothetical protein
MEWTVSRKYWDIKHRLTPADHQRLSVWRYPHRQSLKYYQYQIGLVRKPNMEETIWLNKHTKACYSIDNTTTPHNISFENKQDAIYFKLVWLGTLACKTH